MKFGDRTCSLRNGTSDKAAHSAFQSDISIRAVDFGDDQRKFLKKLYQAREFDPLCVYMTTKHDSFAYAAHTRSPKQLACLDLINEYTFLKENGAPEIQLLVLRRTIEETLDDFSARCDHPRPKWIIPTLRAIALSSFGELVAAIRLETEAMAFAQDDIDRSKNLSNRGEYARQLAAKLSEGAERNDLIASAVEDSLKAMALSAGQNKGIALTAALAFAEAGMLEEADDLIARVSEDSDILNEQGDSLRTHLLNDLNFRKLRSVLPTLEHLYSIIERN